MTGLGIDWNQIAFTRPATPPRIAEIITAAAVHFRISEADVKGECRQRGYARARQVVMFLAREMTAASLPMIARELGNKHHTSILFGARKIAGMLKDNREDMNGHVNAVRALVQSGDAKAAVRNNRRMTLELVAEREAEEAIRHAEKMKQLRRIRDLANAGFISSDSDKRVMSS